MGIRMGTAKDVGKKMLEKIEHLPDVLLKGGLFYAGARAAGQKATIENKILGGTTALVSLRLAESQNLAAGVAGVAGLSAIGILNVVQDNPYLKTDYPDITDPPSTWWGVWDPYPRAEPGDYRG